jgi:hypothetical protein
MLLQRKSYPENRKREERREGAGAAHQCTDRELLAHMSGGECKKSPDLAARAMANRSS